MADNIKISERNEVKVANPGYSFADVARHIGQLCANFFTVLLISLLLFFVNLYKILLKKKNEIRFATTKNTIDKRINKRSALALPLTSY